MLKWKKVQRRIFETEKKSRMNVNKWRVETVSPLQLASFSLKKEK